MEENKNTNEEMGFDDVEIIDLDNENPKFVVSKKAKIIMGSIFAVIAVVYIAVAMYFSNRFLFNTTVNGKDCSGKTIEEVETVMEGIVNGYVLTLEEAGDAEEEIKGTDIGVQFKNVDTIQEELEKQNSFTWITSLFKGNTIEAKVDVTYDEEKLTEKIGALNCMKEENQVASVSAVPVYANGTFEIQEETYGTVIDQGKFNQAIRNSIALMEENLDLTEAGCYILPTYTKDSDEVLKAQQAMNKCLEAKLTWSLDGITVTLDKETISGWLSVDEEMNMVLSSESVSEFVSTLAGKYNTSPRTDKITTPTGKKATVKGATVGRSIGKDAEKEQITADIKAGKTVTREPVIAQQATPEGQYAWGTTYIEVDLSAQHMWYIKGGSVALQTAIVTGKPPQNTTPSGVYSILEKMRNKTLRGDRQPNGEWGYETPVSYWMRVTWSGIGFHDATWQSSFGGSRYLTNGSHGCINMPYSAAQQLYSMISVGCPVIIHY